MLFSLTLQVCKAKFPTSTKTDSNKSVSCKSKWRHFIEVAGLLLRFYKPIKGKRHTKFPEERLKWIEVAVQCPIYNCTENWLHRKYFLWVFRVFKIARRASLEESLFSKVIGEISTLHNLSKTLSLALVSFKK